MKFGSVHEKCLSEVILETKEEFLIDRKEFNAG
jgi:hypothetical protein